MDLPYLQCILAGIFISLSGSLPLGNLNVTAMQIAANTTFKKALWFAVGVTIVEMLYLRSTLAVIDTIKGFDTVFYYFRIGTILLLLVLAAGSFMANANNEQKNILFDNRSNKLVLGLAMSLLNPMQIPFWVGWSIYLIARSLLQTGGASYTVFTLSAGMGTFVALLIFIFAGRKFSVLMQKHQKKVNLTMGCLFVLMAIFQFVKLF